RWRGVVGPQSARAPDRPKQLNWRSRNKSSTPRKPVSGSFPHASGKRFLGARDRRLRTAFEAVLLPHRHCRPDLRPAKPQGMRKTYGNLGESGAAWWRTQCAENKDTQPNSLITGKIQVISPDYGSPSASRSRFQAADERLTAEFPTLQNRETIRFEQ